mmetsp:Transcript_56696/g.143606  ORF Transcript_56696/g.143606 Transcript_56696/m.143606 type:complete len:234 (-) Transcript_56696:216-917(-)
MVRQELLAGRAQTALAAQGVLHLPNIALQLLRPPDYGALQLTLQPLKTVVQTALLELAFGLVLAERALHLGQDLGVLRGQILHLPMGDLALLVGKGPVMLQLPVDLLMELRVPAYALAQLGQFALKARMRGRAVLLLSVQRTLQVSDVVPHLVSVVRHIALNASDFLVQYGVGSVPLSSLLLQNVLQFCQLGVVAGLQRSDILAQSMEVSDEGRCLVPNEPELGLMQLHLLLI